MKKKKKTGYFITFEGIDGCGKTTQLRLADKYLSAQKISTLVLREPGSTPLSEKVRKILLDKKMNINPFSELMLYLAARAELVREVIHPAIKNGTVVLCDRFYDSTTAYQGYGRGLDIGLINKLNRKAAADCIPDLTFLVDINFNSSLLRRKSSNKKADRLESESKQFFQKVRHGFYDIANKNKRRIKVIDGAKSIEAVFEEVKNWLNRKLKI